MNVQTDLRAHLASQSLVRKGVEASAINPNFMKKLFELLFQELINCFDPDDGREVKSYVKSRRGDKRLRKGIARQAKRAGRRAGGRLSWSQAQSVAHEVIEQVDRTEASDITLVIRESD